MTEKKPKSTPAVHYLQHLEALLHVEHEHEKEEYSLLNKNASIAQRIAKGICWYPIAAGNSFYNSVNQYVIEIERIDNTEVEHAFEPGMPVRLFTIGAQGTIEFLNLTCAVSYVDKDKMIVVLPNESAAAAVRTHTDLGVQTYMDETTYKLMFEALHHAISADKGHIAEMRELFHGDAPTQKFKFSPQRFPWLNESQQNAVNKALLAKDVAIVHGPPGTGKTTTLVETIHAALLRENQVLVCAQSNMAVDWISEKLEERGVTVLRIGNPSKVNDKTLSLTFERKFESHPDYPTLWQIRRSIREMRLSLRSGNGNKERIRTKINALKDKAGEMEVRMTEELFSETRAVTCTLAGTASRLLARRRFGTLFIDEAAQALEPACWIALPKADRVILAGDHFQLPPTVKSPTALRDGLGRTLMQEIARNKPECVSLLTMQYRMNEAIMAFPSRWFYRSQLTAAPSVRNRGILDLDTPIEWIDTPEAEHGEETVGDNSGRMNKSEANKAVGQLKAYIEKIGRERILEEHIDFGVISPYKAQARYLRQLLKADAFFKPYRKSISVNTVDGFQGQERDVILVSLVRANAEGRIGFLGDLRRMNVAITRARMKLIILGDVSTLTRHTFYRKLHQYVTALAN